MYKTDFPYLININVYLNRFIPKSRRYVFCYGTIKIAVTVWGFLHYKKAKINRRSYFQRIFVKFLWCCWSYLSSVYCHCFFFAFPNKEKGGVLTCDRLLYPKLTSYHAFFGNVLRFLRVFLVIFFSA